MSILVSCSCGQSFRAKAELAGRRVQCPACGSPLQIPQGAPAPAAPAAPDDPLGLGGIDDRSLGAPLPQTDASRALQAQRQTYARPKPKRKTDWGPILRIAGIVGGIAAGIGALAAVGVVLWIFLGSGRSPEAVFESAKTAAEKQDWEGFCECLTPESRDQIAGMLLMGAMVARGFSGMAALGGPDTVREVEEKFKPLADVLDKHGMDEETMKSLRSEGPIRPGATNQEKLNRVLAPIKDRNQFVADMIVAMQSMGNRDQSTPFQSDATLEDLEVTGDTATGFIVQTRSGTQKRERIDFKRINGSWKIALPTPGR